jgi:hypothetical protein
MGLCSPQTSPNPNSQHLLLGAQTQPERAACARRGEAPVCSRPLCVGGVFIMARRVTLNVSARAVAVAALERPHLDPGAARIVLARPSTSSGTASSGCPSLIGMPAPGRNRKRAPREGRTTPDACFLAEQQSASATESSISPRVTRRPVPSRESASEVSDRRPEKSSSAGLVRNAYDRPSAGLLPCTRTGTRSGPSCGRLQPRAAALDGSMASRETAAPS